MATQHKAPLHKTSIELSFTVESIPQGTTYTLIEFLVNVLEERSRTTIKQLLRDRFVSIDGLAESKATTELKEGQIVRLHQNRIAEPIKHPLLKVLYQDEIIIVLEKRTGISTVGTGVDKKNTALRLVSDHLKQYNPKTRVYMLNRLDRDTAGIILFTTDKDLQEHIFENWSKYVPEQIFRAVVEGSPTAETGVVMPAEPDRPGEIKVGRASDKKNQHIRSTVVSDNSASAGTATYKVLKRGEFCTLMDFRIESGRNNQIRRQMRQAGTPLAGDRHGGSVYKDFDFVALHTKALSLKHPHTGELHRFTMQTPKIFGRLMQTKAAEPNEARNTSNHLLLKKKKR